MIAALGSGLGRFLTVLAASVVVIGTFSSFDADVNKLTEGSDPPALFDRVGQIRAHHLPNVALIDHDGGQRRFYDDVVAGRIVAINFMYTSCSKTCSLSSQAMARLQDDLAEHLGPDVALYSISLDPERDTPEALAAYRAKQGAKSGWTFLTARSVAEVSDLRRKLGVYEPDAENDADLTNHTGMIVLGNEPLGRWTMVPAQVHPVRILQAVERVRSSPGQWVRGRDLVVAVPREESDRSLSSR